MITGSGSDRLLPLVRLFGTAILMLVLVLTLPTFALAHRSSDAFLTLQVTGDIVELQVEISLRDLEVLFAVDQNHDRAVTWRELRQKYSEIDSYIQTNLNLQQDGAMLPIEHAGYLVDRHSDGAYAVVRYTAHLVSISGPVLLSYHILFDHDPQHRAILHFSKGDETVLSILSPSSPSATFALATQGSESRIAVMQFIVEGISHIWNGYDHILFLISLLIPAVLIYHKESGTWEGVPTFTVAFWKIAGIVTSFTIAHSITLALASFGILSLSSQLVECAIAASVGIAAANNLQRFVAKEYLLTFIFGLVHGIGFANVLSVLNPGSRNLVTGLVGFNVGVELGQLGIVAACMPLAFAARNTSAYRIGVLRCGSAAVLLIACAWFVERAFNIKLL